VEASSQYFQSSGYEIDAKLTPFASVHFERKCPCTLSPILLVPWPIHKVAGRGTHRFSLDVVYGQHGLLRLERLPLTAPLCASRRNQSESRMP
jgi:hypothetical protein